MATGISPIEYRPWNGERTAQRSRLFVIAGSVFRHKLRSPGVIVLLVLGFFLVHTFQLLFMAIVPHERLEGADMANYLGNGILVVFALLLAAVVTSDLISEDLSNSSFVLYFSRAIKTRDYLAGKTGAALLVMSILCALPPLLVALASMATQTGDDYWYSTRVLGRTALVGALATVFFVPYGMMLSSFTKRKSYAAVGTFMSFFVLTIVAGVFSEFSPEWRVISPIESLGFSFDWIFGETLPHYIDKSALALFLASFIVVPAVVVFVKLQRQAVGR